MSVLLAANLVSFDTGLNDIIQVGKHYECLLAL